MAFTSNDDAQAVTTLLDYYSEKPSPLNAPNDEAAMDAWEQLAKSAHGKLGAGWRAADVAKHIKPKLNALTRWSKDAEDCEACEHVNGLCPYHEGVEAGVALLREGVEALAEMPDEFNALLDTYQRMKTAVATAAKEKYQDDPPFAWGVFHPDYETVPIRSEAVALYTHEHIPGSELAVRMDGDTDWLRFEDGTVLASKPLASSGTGPGSGYLPGPTQDRTATPRWPGC